MANKYVHETSAAKSVSARIILKGNRYVATVRAHYGNSRVLVNVYQGSESYLNAFRAKAGLKRNAPLSDESQKQAYENFGFQSASASGYGYDKFAAALAGMIIDGHAMSDHSSRDGSPKPPKGCGGLYPEGFKTPKGYSLANWTRASKATGQTFHAYTWRDKAKAELGFPKDNHEITGEQWEQIDAKADAMRQEWEASDDCVTGWQSCYKESGLNYLRALGYSVHQAI